MNGDELKVIVEKLHWIKESHDKRFDNIETEVKETRVEIQKLAIENDDQNLKILATEKTCENMKNGHVKDITGVMEKINITMKIPAIVSAILGILALLVTWFKIFK